MKGVWRAWTTLLWLLLQSQHLGRSRLQSVHWINQRQALVRMSKLSRGWEGVLIELGWRMEVGTASFSHSFEKLGLKENVKNQLKADVKINLLSYKYLPRLFWAYSLPLSLHVLSQLWPHVIGSGMSWCLIYISLAVAWQKRLTDGKVVNGQADRIFPLRKRECEAHFVEAERGQLSHELVPELLLGHQHPHCVESLELPLLNNEPQPCSSAGRDTAEALSSVCGSLYWILIN